METGNRDRYLTLTQAGERAIRRGHYGTAARYFGNALQLAEESEDRMRQDKAMLNLSTAHLHRGEVDDAERGLREMILRSSDPVVVGGACYVLASCLRKQGRYEQALKYARLALEKRRRSGDPVLVGNYHNLIANIHLHQSHLEEARLGYRRALRLFERAPGDQRFLVAICKDNYGYCLLLEKRYERGVGLIEEALALASEIGHERTVAECHQDLGFGYMKRGLYERAEQEALTALKLGRRRRYRDILKNSYYLLGEIHLLQGDRAGADRYFAKLSRFYPSVPFLREFLQAVDISNILNFRT